MKNGSSFMCQHRPHRQLGLSLIEVMLLVFVLGGLLVGGLLSLKTRNATAAVQAQDSALVQADRALVGFAATHNRLPCPDADGDGVEDCAGATQKGRFPFKTVGLDGAGVSVGVNQLRYLVQRQVVELTNAADTWGPIKFLDNTTLYSASHSFAPTNVGTPDLCAKLISGAAVSGVPAAGVAAVASVPQRAVAYALAHPGLKDEDADGSPFDGGNAPNDTRLEAPERSPRTGDYDDRVIERGLASMARTLDCAHLAASINLVSLAAETVDEVHQQKIVNTGLASVLTAISIFKTADAANDAVTAVTAMATAVGWLGTSLGLLSGSIAGCVVIVGCAELPHAIASVVASSAAVVAAAASAALSVVSVTLNVVAAALNVSAAIMAGVSTSVTYDISAALSGAQQIKADATVQKNTAYAEWQTAINAEATVLSQKNAAVTAMYDAARSIVTQANAAGSPTGTLSIYALDARITAVTDRADAWMVAETNYANAEKAYTKAVESTSGGPVGTNPHMASATAAIQAQIDAETDPVKKQAMITALQNMQNGAAGSTTNAQQVQQITDQIAALDAQILANPPNVADLTLLRDQLSDQLANITLDVASALANKNAAEQARVNAYVNYEAAVTAALNASLLPYSVQSCNISGSPAVTTCSTANYTFNGGGLMTAALTQALHVASPFAANRGVYFQWVVSRQKTEAARKTHDAAVAAEDRAISSYNALVSLSTATPGTGSLPAPVWNGAIAILQQADRKGGIR